MARKENTNKKYRAVWEFFTNLYDNKRLRYEDCLTQTANRFFYSVSTVEKIIKKRGDEKAIN